jgi:hypothetical protein
MPLNGFLVSFEIISARLENPAIAARHVEPLELLSQGRHNEFLGQMAGGAQSWATRGIIDAERLLGHRR